MSPASAQREGPLAIEVDDLHVHLENRPVLNGVTLQVPQGEIVALIGPNGSGKTTLLRTLMGLQRPVRGRVRIFGESQLPRILPRVGYMPQKLSLEKTFNLSVREFLSLRLRATRHWFWKSRRALDRALGEGMVAIGVEPLLNQPIASLSGGQLQRVLIAFSLLHHPDLLLLDEPTAGVDLPGEQTFYDLIVEVQRQRRLTVVLVSHDLSMVYRHATWVYALNGVICCEGTPEQIMTTDSLKEAYGIHVSPYHHHHSHSMPGGAPHVH